MSDDYKWYDEDGQERELTIEDYKAVVGQLTCALRLMEDRLNGVEQDYGKKWTAAFNMRDFVSALTDDPHWRWEPDFEDAKSYDKEAPTRIPSGKWKFYCGGPLEMIHEQFNAPTPYWQMLKEKGAVKSI